MMGFRKALIPVHRLGYALLALWLAGCTAHHRMPAPQDGFPGEASLGDLMELMDRRYQGLTTLKALVEVEAKTPEGKGRFYGVLLFQKPDQLRFQGHDFLGRMVFDLIARGEAVRIHLPQENRTLVEETDAFPFFGEQKTSLKLNDFLEVLGASGGVYLDSAWTPAIEKSDTAYILYLFLLQDSHAVLYKKLWLDRIHFRLMKEEIFHPEGYPHMTIFFDHYQKIENQWRPLKIRAQIEGDYQLSLDYSEVHLNPSLGPQDFSLAERR